MKKLRITSPGLLLIVAIAAAGGIFLLDMSHLRPRLQEHEEARLRERAGAAQVTTQFALHVVEDRLIDLCRAWRRDPTVRATLAGTMPPGGFLTITQEIADYHGEHVWLTDDQGQLLASCHEGHRPEELLGPVPADLPSPPTGGEHHQRGLMQLGDTATVFASTRIYARDHSGHVTGTLWIARPLDETVLAASSSSIDGQLVFIPADHMPVGTDDDTAAAHASWINDGQQLMVAWPANDLAGKMLGYFRADVPVTSVYRQTATIRKLVLGILVLSAGVMLLLITGTYILIAGPIVRLLKRLRLFEAGRITTHDLSRKLHGESRLLAGELETAFKRLATQSQTEPLTGLANRGHFERVLETGYHQATRYERPLSLMVIDVDFFKTVNDTHGHQVGDEALKVLAGALKMASRRADVAARLGGDEFCVLMPETSADQAVTVAERLRQIVADCPVDAGSTELTLALSIGITDMTATDISGPDSLMGSADRALYRAKALGRDRVILGKGLDGWDHLQSYDQAAPACESTA